MGWKRALTKGELHFCKGFIIKLSAKPNIQRHLVRLTFQLLERCEAFLPLRQPASKSWTASLQWAVLKEQKNPPNLSKYHNNIMNNSVKKSCNVLPRLLKPDVQSCWVPSTSHDLKAAGGYLRHIYYLAELGTEKTTLHVLFSFKHAFPHGLIVWSWKHWIRSCGRHIPVTDRASSFQDLVHKSTVVIIISHTLLTVQQCNAA